MGIYVFGAWETGLEVANRLRNDYGEYIEGFIDMKKSGSFEKYPIFKPADVSTDDTIIFAHDNIIIAADMYNCIRNMGFENLFWFMNLSDRIKERISFLDDECFRIRNWGDSVLPNMEIHISDKCNLNCRNCTHFSPLYDEIGVDFEKCIEDVRILRSKFSNIGRLDILGGEPLLNPDLDKYIIALKSLLPDTYLNIFTNGILSQNTNRYKKN